MVVDAHVHLFKEYYPFSYVGLIRDLDRIVERLFGEGKLNRAWVLSFPGLKQEAGDEEVLAACRRYPEQLRPFGYLDLRAPAERIGLLRDQGFVGLKSIFPPRPYDDKSLFPYYERAAELKMPILFHMGRCGIFPPGALAAEFDLPSQSTAYHRPGALATIAERLPGLPLIIGHSGCPWHLEAAAVCKRHPNVFLDLSAYPSEEDVRDILATGISTSQILFGSDYPVQHPLERLYRWEVVFSHHFRLSAEDQGKIFGGNAERLLAGLTP